MVSGGLIGQGAQGFAAPVQVSDASILHSGEGAPDATLGTNGDFYFRNDVADTAAAFYVKVAAAWKPMGIEAAHGGMYQWDGQFNTTPTDFLKGWDDAFTSGNAGVVVDKVNGKLTAQAAGVYELNLGITYHNQTAGQNYSVQFRKNGNGGFPQGIIIDEGMVRIAQDVGGVNVYDNLYMTTQVALDADGFVRVLVSGGPSQFYVEYGTFSMKRIG